MSDRAIARLSLDQARALWENEDVFSLGKLAHAARLALHPEPVVTYIVDRNINYTNLCACGCRFCAFFKAPGQPGGYVLSPEELAAPPDLAAGAVWNGTVSVQVAATVAPQVAGYRLVAFYP